ncbi:MAG: hypothetical protein R3F19_13325 [Verrucomicrobiales bacterium]
MQKFSFDDAVEKITGRDDRYSAGGYNFLREALDFTISTLGAARHDPKAKGHVDGSQLLDGFRRLALERFGPMAVTVLNEWGIHCTGDVGEMVFNLIDAEVFGKTDSDTREDFVGVYDFHEAFEQPFLPRQQARGPSQ